MGLKDKMLKKSNETPVFTPLALTEGNAQAIFNRCVARSDSKELTRAYFIY